VAREVLLRFARGDSPTLRRAAARSLSKLEDHTSHGSVLRELAGSGSRGSRIVAEALLWYKDDWADRHLEELRQHDDRRVRWTANQIRLWRKRRTECERFLAGFNNSDSATARWAYAQALSNYGDEDVDEALRAVVGNRDRSFGVQHSVLAHSVRQAILKRMETLTDKLEKDPVWLVAMP
jgi:HEAT repeat protein